MSKRLSEDDRESIRQRYAAGRDLITVAALACRALPEPDARPIARALVAAGRKIDEACAVIHFDGVDFLDGCDLVIVAARACECLAYEGARAIADSLLLAERNIAAVVLEGFPASVGARGRARLNPKGACK